MAFNESEYRKRRRQNAAAVGFCTRCCTKPAKTGKTYCVECTATVKAERRANAEARLARGLCRKCKSPKLETTSYCIYHTIKSFCTWRVRRDGWKKGGASVDEVFDLLTNQDFKCAITGEPLILGVNASIDHIQPRSRGGGNEIENLQWVTKRVNWMKGNYTPDEFLDVCEHILAYCRPNTTDTKNSSASLIE